MKKVWLHLLHTLLQFHFSLSSVVVNPNYGWKFRMQNSNIISFNWNSIGKCIFSNHARLKICGCAQHAFSFLVKRGIVRSWNSTNHGGIVNVFTRPHTNKHTIKRPYKQQKSKEKPVPERTNASKCNPWLNLICIEPYDFEISVQQHHAIQSVLYRFVNMFLWIFRQKNQDLNTSTIGDLYFGFDDSFIQ